MAVDASLVRNTITMMDAKKESDLRKQEELERIRKQLAAQIDGENWETKLKIVERAQQQHLEQLLAAREAAQRFRDDKGDYSTDDAIACYFAMMCMPSAGWDSSLPIAHSCCKWDGRRGGRVPGDCGRARNADAQSGGGNSCFRTGHLRARETSHSSDPEGNTGGVYLPYTTCGGCASTIVLRASAVSACSGCDTR
jgi:hypothetical protein